MSARTQGQADTGDQGLAKLHANSLLPKKRSKRQPLDKEDKRRNRAISSTRCGSEHILRELKIYKILAERYRNRRRRFALRFNLISALYNLNLLHP
jgi:hypothetical protein